jgi:thioredoxin 1
MFYVVDGTNFKELVLDSSGMVLVNFWAWWNEECRKMSSLMRDVANILDEHDAIMQVDWNQQKKLAQKLDVVGVPTLLIYLSGKEVARYSGSMSKGSLLKRIVEAKNTKNK